MKLFNSKLDQRIALGKMIGFIGGIIGVLILPFVFTTIDTMFIVALFLWYVTLGAIIGVFGIWDTLPVFNIKIHYWLRGMWLGGWMNFLLALFAYDKISVLLSNSSFAGWSPFRIILEGAVFGLFVDYITTKNVGEGKKLVK